MKLIVRTNYWGELVQGSETQPKRAPFKPYRTLLAQVDFEDELDYGGSGGSDTLGCCPDWSSGGRTFEMTERHFLDAHNGTWNLYWTRSQHHQHGATAGSTIREFLLAPDNQTCIDVKRAMKNDGWVLWGTLDACILRMDLEPLLRSIEQENKRCGRTVAHAHLFVLMDEAHDVDPRGQSYSASRGKRGRVKAKNRGVLKDTQNILNNVNTIMNHKNGPAIKKKPIVARKKPRTLQGPVRRKNKRSMQS